MRVFKNYNKVTACPVCGTTDDEPAVLIPVPGTEDDGLMEARQLHAHCFIKELMEENVRLNKALEDQSSSVRN